MCKVAENLGVMILTLIAGHLRVRTGGFIAVHCLFALVTLIATGITYNYMGLKQRAAISKEKNSLKIVQEETRKEDDEEARRMTDISEEKDSPMPLKEQESSARKISFEDSQPE